MGQYKKAVDRIENGLKQCREMQMLLKDRAFIEETYFINLKEWAEKYDKVKLSYIFLCTDYQKISCLDQ